MNLVSRLALGLMLVPLGWPQDSTTPVKTDTDLKQESKTVLDAKVTFLAMALKGPEMNLQWAEDTKSAIVADGGIIRKITYPDFKEVININLGALAWGTAFSKSGIVAGVGEELWLLDCATLEVKKKVPFMRGERVVSSPAIDLAFSTDRVGYILQYVNLSTGKISKCQSNEIQKQFPLEKTKRHKTSRGFAVWKGMEVTPDGKFLFCLNLGTLARFSIKGETLALEELGPDMNGPFMFSADSRYVARCVVRYFPDSPPVESGGAYVYKVADLQTAVAGLSQGRVMNNMPSVGRVAFDRESGVMLGTSDEGLVAVWDSRGVLVKQYPIFTRNDRVERIFLHPLGGRFLAIGGAKAAWVEMPR